jgi:hypothetical protein
MGVTIVHSLGGDRVARSLYHRSALPPAPLPAPVFRGDRKWSLAVAHVLVPGGDPVSTEHRCTWPPAPAPVPVFSGGDRTSLLAHARVLVPGGDPVTTEHRRTWPPAPAPAPVFRWEPQMVARSCLCYSFWWGSSDDRTSAHMATRTRSRSCFFRWGPHMVARSCSCSSFRWGFSDDRTSAHMAARTRSRCCFPVGTANGRSLLLVF